jgi:hypothetical protein
MGAKPIRSCRIKQARGRLANRAVMETMAEYAKRLEPRDQQLLDAYFACKFSLYELARIRSTPRTTLRRQIARLITRLSDPMFPAVLRFGPMLPSDLGELAHAHYVRGRSYTELARDFAIPYHQVRYRMLRAREMLIALSLRDAGLPRLAAMFI